MLYTCPKCNRYGMEWDGRGKVLICLYGTCRHAIRIKGQKTIPSNEQIEMALGLIGNDRED